MTLGRILFSRSGVRHSWGHLDAAKDVLLRRDASGNGSPRLAMKTVCNLRDRVSWQVSGLGENLEDRGAEPSPGGFVPFWHLGVSTTAIVKVLIPKAVRQSFAEDLVLLTDDQIEEVPEQGALLDRRGQDGMGGDRRLTLRYQPPKVRRP